MPYTIQTIQDLDKYLDEDAFQNNKDMDVYEDISDPKNPNANLVMIKKKGYIGGAPVYGFTSGIGALAGAGVGTLAGHFLGNTALGAGIGALAGAGLGAGTGYLLDRKKSKPYILGKRDGKNVYAQWYDRKENIPVGRPLSAAQVYTTLKGHTINASVKSPSYPYYERYDFSVLAPTLTTLSSLAEYYDY